MEYEDNGDKSIGADMMMIKKQSKTDRLINKLVDLIPDRLTGNKDIMYQKYYSIYGKEKAEEMVTLTKRKTGKLYLIAFVLVIAMICAFIINTTGETDLERELFRNEYEGEPKTLSAEVEAIYNGENKSENADIIIQPKALSEKEKHERIDVTKNNLIKLILGDNSGIANVTSNLNLLTLDPDTGVEIAWKSDNEELISDEGEVNPLVAKENETAVLDAYLRIEEITDNVKLNIAFGKPKPGIELMNAISASVNNLINNLNEDNKGDKLVLPDKTPEGVTLKWKQNESTTIFIEVFLILLVFVCIYFNRYNSLHKKIKATRESILRDFPDFINKLVLLLNAGMVVTAAFEKITQDYKNRVDQSHEKYLYEELCKMQDNIRFTNSGFLDELNDIAQRSGVRDVMRFNTIIVDNIGKGSALVEKLQNESQILWTGRIKMAEERGKIAETKLTFPMVLQLLVLIIITIAPAAMAM